MNQFISPTPGSVPTHPGNPKKTRYIGATIFIDPFTGFTYIHLMSEMNAKTNVEEKRAFGRILNKHKVKAKYYHGDNGLFDTKLFKESIKTAGQT